MSRVSATQPQMPSGDSGVDGALTTTELVVEGMHCGSCVALVQESLEERPGVSQATVDLDSGRAVVRYHPAQVGVDDLRSIVAEAGYSAVPVG